MCLRLSSDGSDPPTRWRRNRTVFKSEIAVLRHVMCAKFAKIYEEVDGQRALKINGPLEVLKS
jgi:hypothetical protein